MNYALISFCAGIIIVFICFLLKIRGLKGALSVESSSRVYYKNLSDSHSDTINFLKETLEASNNEAQNLTSRVMFLEDAYKNESESSKDILKEAAKYEEKFLELSRSYGTQVIDNENLIKEVERWRNNAGKELSHRKSSEVRTGKIAEKFAALMGDFPYPLDDATFLGMPIDFICYSEDGVHFVEVKSGNSALSPKQKKIKDLINEGKVSFEVFRINTEE